MNKSLARLAAVLLSLQLLSACDSPSALTASHQGQSAAQVRVNLIPAASPQAASTVQINDLSQLPEALRSSAQLNVIFDASKTLVRVQRNADGSLSFPLNTGRSFGSGSSLTLLMVGDGGVSYPLELLTGVPLQLGATPITASPASTVTLGTRLQLAANLGENTAERYLFGWEVAPSAAGPWQGLAGNDNRVEWEPRQAGAYYVRLGITDTTTRSVSSYLSPTPLIYVLASDEIVLTTPVGGSIVAGDEISLKANLPEFSGVSNPDFQWAYATSAQGPFQPIAARGPEISWEPPAAGAYFLRLQAEREGRLSTYVTSAPEVFVVAPDEVILTDPAGGSVVRGQSVTLATSLTGLSAQSSYSWFYAFAPAGPFTPIAGSGRSLSWTPPLTGEFYIRLRSFDPVTNQSRTYTSAQTEVSVRDSNTVFSVTPSGSLRRGESVSLSLNGAPSEQVSWAYASSLQGAFNTIPASGRTIRWTPAEAGSFYLRAAATRPDGTLATFTSADPQVFVAERANVILSNPAGGQLELGQAVSLRADITESGSALRYVWSYSSSPTGPFAPLQTLESSPLQAVTWYPPMSGSYFVRVEVTNPVSQSTLAFTSSEPIVRVSETKPFFSTDPVTGRIKPDETIRILAGFEPGNRSFNFGWSYGRSTVAFTPIGGSSVPEVRWDDRNKPVGSYYIRLQATAPGSDRSLSFISRYPLVFVDESTASGNEFGVPKASSSTAPSR